MSRFPSDAHLSSWAGASPGNNESAGKRRSGRVTQGDKWLKSALVEAAWAASKTKNTYLSARYRRLAARRGKKRAALAVGHTILIMAYHIIKERRTYNELGADYFDRLNEQHLVRRLISRITALGYEVEAKNPPDSRLINGFIFVVILVNIVFCVMLFFKFPFLMHHFTW